MRKFLRREEGQVEIIVPFLVLLLFTAMVWGVRAVQLVTLADVNLKQSVAISVRAAASQGLGEENSYIDPEAARKAFEEMLARNLGLDPATLGALENSAWKGGLEYRLWVYDGTDGAEYVFRDGRLVRHDIPGEGFPRTFILDGSVEVTLSTPGVIGAVSLTARSVAGPQVKCERWAAARIEGHERNKVVVLQRGGTY